MKCIKTVLFGRPNMNCFMADLYAKFICKTRQTIKNSADMEMPQHLNLKGTAQRHVNTKYQDCFSDFNVFNLEEYEAVWRPEVLYTNKEVNLLSHEVNMEARLMVVRNETLVYR